MRNAIGLTGAVVTLILLACGAVSGPASAHDSLSPRGAPHHWLPKEDWVYRHWLPFDEQTLKVLLGLRGRGLEAYLFDDHRTLADLVAARGLTLQEVEDALLDPWVGEVDEARMATLRDHTRRILTQGHLAQHMFFHIYHGVDVRAHARQLFGVSSRRYWHLKLRRYSGRRVARIGGVSRRHVISGLSELFAEDTREGIRLQVALPVEAERMQQRRLDRLACWYKRPITTLDPLAPYGRQHDIHGPHARDFAATARGRRIGTKRVERYRKRLAPSCYKVPPPWPPGDRADATAARAAAVPRRASRNPRAAPPSRSSPGWVCFLGRPPEG